MRLSLTGDDAFARVLAQGQRQRVGALVVIVAPGAKRQNRSGFSIGRKLMPRAIDRNRLRRRLREVVRKLEREPSVDVVFRLVGRCESIATAVGEATRLLRVA